MAVRYRARYEHGSKKSARYDQTMLPKLSALQKLAGGLTKVVGFAEGPKLTDLQ
jgi:hypothetical protein